MNPLFIKNLSNIQRFLLILFAVVICMIYGIINEIILNWGNICAIAKKLWDFLGILGIFEISAVVFLIIVLFRFILKRIDLNRHLFGKSAWRPIIFSIFLIASVVLTISFTNRCVLHIFHYNLSEELIIKDIQLNNGTNIDNLYAILSQFMDPGNLPSASGKGRAFAIILALLGIILLSGLAVSTFINALGKKSDAWKKGMIHYGKSNLKNNKYTIIIGVDELTTAIVKQAIASGADYVLIQTRQDVEKMRERLDLGLDKYDENKVVFYYGERTSEEDIKTLRPERCREVYILGEDLGCEDERDHDSYNIKCVELIAAILKKKSNKKRSRIQLRCHVNFEYQGTFTAFKATHHYSELQKSINFLPFNVHDLWAKKILVDNFAIIPGKNKGELEVQKYFPLDSYREDGQVKYITKDNKGDNDAKAVHLIIIGMNQMGTALGVQAALTAHYPNFKYDRTLRTTITYIDDHAKAEGEYLRGRYEALFCLCRHRTIVCDDNKQTGIDSASNWIDPLSQAKEIAGQKDNVQNERFRYLGNNTSENLDDCNFMDIQWEFIQGNVASKEIIDYLLAITADTHKTTTIAVCFNDPQKSIATALYLPGRVVRGANQLLVYQQNSFDLIDKVAKGENDWRRYKNMFPFGMTDGAYTGDEVENTIAKLQNYIFLKQDVARSDLRKFSSSIFYDINRSWDDLGMVLRQSNIDFAESVPSKLRSIRGKKYNGNPDNIELTNEIIFAMAESEHLRWVTQKLISGFRPLTEEEYKDFEIGKFDKEYFKRSKRAHLDICSYERLEKVDSKMPQNDKNTIKDLVLMLKATEWINRMEIKERSLASKFILGKNGMCFIESGEILYTLKSDNGLEERKSLELKHSRWMGATPVTKEQWYAVTGKNRPKRFKKKHPVVEVSKEDVDNFILILNKKTGLYFALPSIKEWEYVARHTDNKNNNKFGVQNLLGKVWQWTREEANGHEQCFYFCGGSTKFGENERDMENPIEYWKSYWNSKFKSDDLGFRLVWKSDAIPQNISESTDIDDKIRKEKITKWLNEEGRWAKIRSGYFIMGASRAHDQKADFDEGPEHFVKISNSFEICSIPVTQELWNLVKDVDYRTNPAPVSRIDLPQTYVSHEDVDLFLEELTLIVNDGYIYRLPTEAEWEYAAKGGHDSKMARAIMGLLESHEKSGTKPLTDEDMQSLLNHKNNKGEFDYKYMLYAGSDNAADVAWFNEDGVQTVQPVKIKSPLVIDGINIYDMSGNIWEWVSDFYKADAYYDCIKTDDYKTKGYYTADRGVTDDKFSAHVFRGGSYLFDKQDCRCTKPSYWIKSYKSADLGFRLVRTQKTKEDK